MNFFRFAHDHDPADADYNGKHTFKMKVGSLRLGIAIISPAVIPVRPFVFWRSPVGHGFTFWLWRIGFGWRYSIERKP